MELMVTRG